MGTARDDDVADRLGDFLAARLERDTVEVRGLRRLSGGASRETWEFDLFDALDGSTEPLILQRVRAGPLAASFSMESESRLLAAAADGGVPVAPVVAASDDPEVVGSPFLVMGRIAGETIARRILRDDEFASARPRAGRAVRRRDGGDPPDRDRRGPAPARLATPSSSCAA